MSAPTLSVSECRDPAPRSNVRAAATPHFAATAVRGEDDDRGQGRLQGAVEVREALHVQHVHLVDEEHPRHELRHALVDVLVDHLEGGGGGREGGKGPMDVPSRGRVWIPTPAWRRIGISLPSFSSEQRTRKQLKN